MVKLLCLLFITFFNNLLYADVIVNSCSYLDNTKADNFTKITQCINFNLKHINKIYDLVKTKANEINPIIIDMVIDKNGKSEIASKNKIGEDFELIYNYFEKIRFPIIDEKVTYSAYFDESGKFIIEKSLINGNVYANSYKPINLFLGARAGDSDKGRLPTESIRKTIDSYGSELYQKYLIALHENPQLAGTIRFKIEILPTGVVNSVSVATKDSTISDKLVEELESIISKMTFPKSDMGAKVTYPINLYPD